MVNSKDIESLGLCNLGFLNAIEMRDFSIDEQYAMFNRRSINQINIFIYRCSLLRTTANDSAFESAYPHAWLMIYMNDLLLRNVNHLHVNRPDKCFATNNGIDDRNVFDKL